MRIGADSQLRTRAGLHYASVIASSQGWVVQGGQECFGDQVLHHLAAAAVPHHDFFAMLQWNRANRPLHGWEVIRHY